MYLFEWFLLILCPGSETDCDSRKFVDTEKDNESCQCPGVADEISREKSFRPKSIGNISLLKSESIDWNDSLIDLFVFFTAYQLFVCFWCKWNGNKHLNIQISPYNHTTRYSCGLWPSIVGFRKLIGSEVPLSRNNPFIFNLWKYA